MRAAVMPICSLSHGKIVSDAKPCVCFSRNANQLMLFSLSRVFVKRAEVKSHKSASLQRLWRASGLKGHAAISGANTVQSPGANGRIKQSFILHPRKFD